MAYFQQLENNIKSKEIGVDISDLTLENTKVCH